MQTIFQHCIVSDDVRLELENKASIMGLYGLTPNVSIAVQFPDRPIPRLSFLLASGLPVPLGMYRTRLKFIDPSGVNLFENSDDEILSEVRNVPSGINVIFTWAPLPLNDFGIYKVIAVVNGKDDYASELTISQDLSVTSPA